MDSQVEPMHVLTLDMLLLVLQSHQQTCILSANIPAAILAATGIQSPSGKARPLSHARLSVVKGQAQPPTCSIRNQGSGQVILEGQMAFELLRRCGELAWSIQPVAPPSTRPALPPVSQKVQGTQQEDLLLSHPPHLVVNLTMTQLDVLPRKHRRVLILVNGQRDVNELCHILHYSPDEITAILEDLSVGRYVIWPGSSKRR